MQSLWMIVASLLFACMGVCVKLGSAHFSTGELVFYRGFVGLLLMAVLARWQGIAYATPHWRRQLSRGLSGTDHVDGQEPDDGTQAILPNGAPAQEPRP